MTKPNLLHSHSVEGNHSFFKGDDKFEPQLELSINCNFNCNCNFITLQLCVHWRPFYHQNVTQAQFQFPLKIFGTFLTYPYTPLSKRQLHAFSLGSLLQPIGAEGKFEYALFYPFLRSICYRLSRSLFVFPPRCLWKLMFVN